jgi:hypothetical protein
VTGFSNPAFPSKYLHFLSRRIPEEGVFVKKKFQRK